MPNQATWRHVGNVDDLVGEIPWEEGLDTRCNLQNVRDSRLFESCHIMGGLQVAQVELVRYSIHFY